MICYTFEFYEEGSSEPVTTQDIWAHYETEAWHKASEVAYWNGYVDFKLVD